MNHCDTCKYWEGKPHSPLGACALTYSDSAAPLESKTLAYAHDFDNYHAWLITKPNFYCNQFQVKR